VHPTAAGRKVEYLNAQLSESFRPLLYYPIEKIALHLPALVPGDRLFLWLCILLFLDFVLFRTFRAEEPTIWTYFAVRSHGEALVAELAMF